MAEDNMTVPGMDHDTSDANNGQSEADLLAAALQSSAMADELGLNDDVPLPDEEYSDDDPAESVEEEDPEETEEVVSDEEEGEVDEETTDEDSTDTQDAEVYTLDDLDPDALFTVKVDGEELNIPLADLVKNYQQDASISNKGRELGEARKQLEAERAEAIEQLNVLGQASTAMLMQEEQVLAREYHKIKQDLDKLDEDDDYEYGQVKRKLDKAQAAYWEKRNAREQLTQAVQQQNVSRQEQEWNQKLQYFEEHIGDYLPEFNEDMATDIREFVISEGLEEDFLNQIVHPSAVKLMNDYRLLKQSLESGEAKRKNVPTKKAVPTKKPKSKNQKKQDKAAMTKARAFREGASKDDQQAFLRQIAEQSLSKL